MPEHNQPWVVLKFGGSSVSSASNWRNIVGVLKERLAAGLRPVVVHSALSGITDRLESLLAAAAAGTYTNVLAEIETVHRDLASVLSIVPDERFETFITHLRDLAAGAAGSRDISDRLRARVMAMGELLATSLGASYLNAQGVRAAWVDARAVLRAERRHAGTSGAGFLSATCDFSPDAQLQAQWRAFDQ